MENIGGINEQEKIKIIIADTDMKRAETVSEFLQEDSNIKVEKIIQSGKSTLEEILSEKYVLAIVCLSLIENDGLWVLEELQKHDCGTKVIAVNDFNNPKFSELAISLGADYCITKPFDRDIIKKRIIQICELDKMDGNAQDMDTREISGGIKIAEFIGKIGIKPNLKGYSYLKYAIPYIIKNKYSIDVITKELYPEIARVFKTEPKSVERNIRNCIEISWETSSEKYKDIFGYEFKKRPTNKEFIHAVVDYIRENKHAR